MACGEVLDAVLTVGVSTTVPGLCRMRLVTQLPCSVSTPLHLQKRCAHVSHALLEMGRHVLMQWECCDDVYSVLMSGLMLQGPRGRGRGRAPQAAPVPAS